MDEHDRRSGNGVTRRLGGAALVIGLTAAALLVQTASGRDHAGDFGHGPWGPDNPRCGPPHREKALKDVGQGRPPLTIGDSVMLPAVHRLARAGYDADARGCRSMKEGLALLRHRRELDKLPRLSVIALGIVWVVRMKDIRAALRVVGRADGEPRLLGLVTPRSGRRRYSVRDGEVMRRAARKFPHRIVLLDWFRYSKDRPGWFQPDGGHLTDAGVKAYTRLHKTALPYAPWGGADP